MLTRIPHSYSVAAFIALLTLFVVGPLWELTGLPAASFDLSFHLHRTAAVARAHEQGVFWPRWFPEVHNDLGGPVFHHYGSLFYWLVASASHLDIGLDQAFKLVVTGALLLAAWGVFAWLRHAFSPEAALCGATVFLVHPDIATWTFYFGGRFPQFFSVMLLPVCLWAMTALHARSRPAYWLSVAAALAFAPFAARGKARSWGVAGALFSLLTLFLLLPASEPFWRTVSGEKVGLFIYRFLSLATLGAAPAAAFAVDLWKPARRWLPALTLLLLSGLAFSPFLFPAHTEAFSPFPVPSLSADQARAYERRTGNLGMSGYGEFNVVGADLDMIRGRKPEPPTTALHWRSPHRAVARLSDDGAPALLRLHYHPAWSASTAGAGGQNAPGADALVHGMQRHRDVGNVASLLQAVAAPHAYPGTGSWKPAAPPAGEPLLPTAPTEIRAAPRPGKAFEFSILAGYTLPRQTSSLPQPIFMKSGRLPSCRRSP